MWFEGKLAAAMDFLGTLFLFKNICQEVSYNHRGSTDAL